MANSVLIMAGGGKRAWAPGGYRQLLSVGGETLIDRVIRQVREMWGCKPVIVTNNHERPFGLDCRYFIPESGRTPAESLSQTEMFWADTTLVLQGDTYYPDVAIQLIDRKQFFGYGRLAELYALKWTRSQSGNVKTAIKRACGDRVGRLWCVYRGFEGIPIDQHRFGTSFYNFKEADSPRDFDKLEQYQNYIERATV